MRAAAKDAESSGRQEGAEPTLALQIGGETHDPGQLPAESVERRGAARPPL
jgi:hypothetical protein